MDRDIPKEIYTNVIEKFKCGGMEIYSSYILSEINYSIFLLWLESNILNQ